MASTLLESPHEPAGLGDVVADAAATAAMQLESGPAQPAENSTPGSIAAYYSLAFPNFTYYLQTLDVTIGRRLVTEGPSEDGAKSVDVDLGPLKSVSRLHAKITYDDEDERWVLDIYGRNGAWVDGIWSGPGSRVPLESRSQIQIASRSFSFILPPSDPPDESPLTSSPTSTTRPRSPSLDATSLSPASSPVSVHSPTPLDPEHAAEPEIVQPSKPKLIRKRAASDSDQDIHVSPVLPQESKPLPAPEPEPDFDPEPEAEVEPEPEPELKQAPAPKPAPAKVAKAAASKSKPKTKPPTKPPPADVSDAAESAAPAPPKPAPYVRLPGQPEPQKPAATLSQLCYRAIKALDGRATLQGILCWIMDSYEWYRAHAGEKWESSVRHNLSSNAAFVKSQRNSNEPGKGAFWCIDPNHIATFEAVEARLNAGPSTKPGKGKAGGKTPTTTDTSPVAPKVKKEPPANASVPVLVAVPILPPGVVLHGAQASKGLKPPPPPLMSTRPLASPFTTKPLAAKPIASPFTTRPLQHKAPSATHASPVARPPAHPAVKIESVPTSVLPPAAPSTIPPSAAPVASTSSDGALHVPIVVGPLPSSYSLAEGAEPPPIVLHEGRLILAPKAFAHLTADEIREFEKLGAQKALAALQVHVVKFLKEQMRLRGRGRGRGRGAPGRGAAAGRGPLKMPADTSTVAAPVPDATMANASSAPDVTMRDVGAAETPEESTAPRSQSQVRPRSNSSEATDVPAPKRARVDSSVA